MGVWRRIGLAAVVLLALGVAGAQAQSRPIVVEPTASEKRVALVIGNAAYPSPADLKNPVNDAQDMAEALRGAGFDVISRTNATQKQMQQALREFGGRLTAGGVGLFYFAGHGVQVKGKNFLIPIGAAIKSEAEAEDEAVDVNGVLAKMAEAGNRVNIVVLDACRDNPFARGFRSGARGLATVGEAPSGTLIAYATGPGRVAADGAGRNGIYTGELLKAMREPGLKLEDVFKRVIRSVRQATREQQVPWTLSSVDGDFIFRPLRGGAAVASVPPPAEPEVKIVPRVGSLVIRSLKESVEVWLGERRLGDASPAGDLQVDRIAAGSHVVKAKARRAGFKPWEREVLVADNQRAEVVIDIEPLRSEPPPPPRSEDGTEMVRVPAGEFTMGSDDHDNEKPPHRVYLDAYAVDKYEVTNALYKRFMDATGRAAPAYWTDAKWNGATQPVVGVSWHDADAYCRWAGKRLPTEAEWEKAARGTDGRKYPWGDQWEASRANAENKLGKTAPVGSYSSGVSPYGAHDMAGNVWEWVADWYDAGYYKQTPERNPQGPASGSARVLRGGSWNHGTVSLRASDRDGSAPVARYGGIGFRCARGSS
jgi:formylglycine-generating enzyme required for sulfatase activity